jgi:hypothetical protein
MTLADTLLESLEGARRRERLEEESRVRGALSDLLSLLKSVAPELAPSSSSLWVARLDPAARPVSWPRATVNTNALEAISTFERDGSLSLRIGIRLDEDTQEARTVFVCLRYSVPDRRVRVAGSRWLEPSGEEVLPALREALEAEVASWYPRGRAVSRKKIQKSLG